jgi:hypothetical protein
MLMVRTEVGPSRAPGQPAVWTLIDVEGPDELAGDVARAWSAGLFEHQTWYADFRVGQEHVVVFPGRVFPYTMGDADGRRAAVEYGRATGVPEAQLDWGA